MSSGVLQMVNSCQGLSTSNRVFFLYFLIEPWGNLSTWKDVLKADAIFQWMSLRQFLVWLWRETSHFPRICLNRRNVLKVVLQKEQISISTWICIFKLNLQLTNSHFQWMFQYRIFGRDHCFLEFDALSPVICLC